MLNVAITIEAIIILDADKEKLNRKGPQFDAKFVKAEAIETLGAMRRGGLGGVPGLAMLGWSVSPWGPYLEPLNPPKMPERNYQDIVQRNPFVDSTGFNNDLASMIPFDDLQINKMRFNRFIGLTMEQSKSGREVYEGLLWDMAKNETQRVRTLAAFSNIPLVLTAPIPSAGNRQNTLVRAVVTKVEDRRMIVRVGLNSHDPERPKWWNYPDDGFAYNLDPKDKQRLENEDRISVLPGTQLTVISSKSWDSFVKRGLVTFKNDTTGSSFHFPDRTAQAGTFSTRTRT